MKKLKIRTRRAGAHNITTRVIDSTKVIKKMKGTADRVLIDAPCSGIGVIRRNPDSKWKSVIWTLGITLPATTSYLRHNAGKHFPTDVISGYLVGATIGYLVPHFHKTNTKDSSLQIWPSANGVMLMFTHRLH